MAAACRRNYPVFLTGLILMSLNLLLSPLAHAKKSSCSKTSTLSYYLQQDFGKNEFQMVPAAVPAAPGTTTGFGRELVHEFVMTETAAANSSVMGYVRGTAISVSVNSTASPTAFFVSEVIHYDYGGVSGTLYQQGEILFPNPSWELAIVGGTGAFRFARGYNVGTRISFTVTSNTTTHSVTHYDTSFCMCPCYI